MLYYISPGVFPSKKAHSIQTVSMCEAFVRNDKRTTLVHPSYGKGKVDLNDIKQFYGIDSKFSIKTLPSFAEKNQVPNVPTSGEMTISFWLLLQYLRRNILSTDIIYSRYLVPTYFLIRSLSFFPERYKPTIIFEQHKPQSNHPLLTSEFYNRLDGVVCTAEEIRDHIIPYLDIKRTLVAPNGVDVKAYDKLTTKEARAQLSLPIDTDIIAYTGHLYPDKNVEKLIKIAPHLDVDMYIVGGYDEDINRIKNTVTGSECVTFTGFVPPSKIIKYQKASDILVVTSNPDTEYYSQLKLFEYMAAQKPIIATRTPAFEEILKHETHCLFTPPDSEIALLKNVRQILEKPELSAKLATEAYDEVQQYSWVNRAKRILSFIQRINNIK